MSPAGGHLLAGLGLLADSVRTTSTSPLVLVIAAACAALRAHQLFTGDADWRLELLVGSLRVALVTVVVAAARAGASAGGPWWTGVGRDVVRTYRTGWPGVLLQLAVVTVVLWAVGLAVGAVVTACAPGAVDLLGLDAEDADRAARAATAAAKNVVVIPVYLVALLAASGIVRR